MLKERRAYEARLDRQLAAWGTDLEDLKCRTRDVTLDGMMKFDQVLATLKRKHAEASVHLRELKEASDAGWDQVKVGTEKAWEEFMELFQHSSEH